LNSTSVWSSEVPIKATVRLLAARPVEVALAAGVVFRLVAYLSDRPYWMDEGSIVGCILGLDRSGLFGPLGSTQLAPPGFLASEWAAIHLFGVSRFAFRLVPLLTGLISLFLFRDLARRCLSGRGEVFAVSLFAVMDDLIYFASEVKQYSSDLALTLLCLGVASRVDRGPRSAKQALGLVILGVGVVWCSHPSIFTLAAIGTVGLIRALGGRDAKRSAAWIGVGLAWLASFALVHAVAMRQLGHRRDMWAFWDFAFPTIPPRSSWDLIWPIRRVAFLFASPLNFDAPFLDPRWSIWPAFALMIFGSARMIRDQPSWWFRLILPGGFALVAAYLRFYPFHGRLLLFFAPLLLVPVAAGLEAIRPKIPRRLLMIWVVGFPILAATYHLFEPYQRDHNPYGDRRPSSLNPYRFPLGPLPRAYGPQPKD